MILRCAAIAVAFCALAIVSPVKSDEGPKYTVLAMEYFGALNKPIDPIVISNSYGGAEWYQNSLIEKGAVSKFRRLHLHVVSPPLLGRLIATVESHKGGVQPEPGKQYIYNGVSMTIVTPQGRKIFLFHIEPAMTLIDQLEKLCKDDKSLLPDLLYFQKMVRPWGDMSAPRPSPQVEP
jgi:hypothetical protein